MSRPQITSWAGPLFKRQLNAALDWLESFGGGGGIGGGGTVIIDGGDLAAAHPTGAVTVTGGTL